MRQLLLIILFFTTFSFCKAEEKADQYLFPVPPGEVNIVNGYEIDGGWWTHQGSKAKYSIDFQLMGNNPNYPKLEQQCFSLGTPILATKKGKIIDVRNPEIYNTSYGYMVRVGYSDNSYTWYAHIMENTIAVKKGDEVEAGQILGLMGATGIVSGRNCPWENDIGVHVNNEAPHLHLETNTSEKLAILQEPMIGKEIYTDLRKANSPYTSATQMIDPTGHWGKYAGSVPYEYKGNYVAMASLSAHKPRIQSFSPGMAVAGTNQVFTIKGENLPKELFVSLPGCAGFKWLKQEPQVHQFSCTLAKVAEPRSGFIRFSEKGSVEFNFKIDTVKELGPEVFPQIKQVDIQATKGGKEAQFKVSGSNLPTDLKLNLKTCTEFKYKTAKSDLLEFSCLLPRTIKNSNGQRPNGKYTFHANLVSESTQFAYPVSFSADYEVQITSMSPASAIYGKEMKMILKGKNLDLIKVLWVEACKDMRLIKQEAEVIEAACIPYKPGAGSWDALRPDWTQYDLYDVVAKDQEKGTTLFKGGIVVGQSPVDLAVQYQPQATSETEDHLSDLKNTDDLIQYILNAKGNYDEAFLKKVGWRKKNQLYTPAECQSEWKERSAQANMTKECLK